MTPIEMKRVMYDGYLVRRVNTWKESCGTQRLSGLKNELWRSITAVIELSERKSERKIDTERGKF